MLSVKLALNDMPSGNFSEAGLAKIMAMWSDERNTAGRSETRTVIRGMVRMALEAVQEVAAPWIGFCLTLEVRSCCHGIDT